MFYFSKLVQETESEIYAEHGLIEKRFNFFVLRNSYLTVELKLVIFKISSMVPIQTTPAHYVAIIRSTILKESEIFKFL